jgi:glycosyltransferase involved in cell wall biosynthesis
VGVPKIIFTAHGWPFNEPRNFIWRLSIFIASYLTSLLATETIVIHRRDFVATRYWPFVQKKIALIHSGIGENFYLSRLEAREKLANLIGKPTTFFEDKVLLGNVAELHFNKGLLYGLRAMEFLPANFIYIILGDGDERAVLEKFINESKLTDRVFLPGFVSSASVLMKGFDIFLFPSVKEGLSFTILEAGLAGLPVVATDVGGTPDIIESRVSGILVPPKNPKALSKAVLALKDDHTSALRLGHNLQQKVITAFNLEKMLKTTISHYLKS